MKAPFCFWIAAVSSCWLTFAQAEDPPEVRVENVRRVFHNGEHNAFTDLCRFGDHIYLTFRSCPLGHMVHPNASVIVLRSRDGNDWEQVHQFSVQHRDTRDPHFLVFKDRLFVYTGTWYTGDTSPAPASYDLNKHLGYAVWTDDGEEWQGPKMLEGTYGHYIWRAAEHDGRAYLCGRRKPEFAEFDDRSTSKPHLKSVMLESEDGLIWRKRAFFQEEWGDETAFAFEPDGSILAVARRGSSEAELCRSNSPWTEWRRTTLGRYIGGPLLVKWQGHYLVGGRQNVEGEGPRTTLYWLVNDELQEFARLPSGGDNSYAGLVEMEPGRALLSWYSTHETNAEGEPITAIYLADLIAASATKKN